MERGRWREGKGEREGEREMEGGREGGRDKWRGRRREGREGSHGRRCLPSPPRENKCSLSLEKWLGTGTLPSTAHAQKLKGIPFTHV